MRRRPYQGHPLVKLAGTAARLPRYLKLANGLARDGSVSPARKAALVGGLGYALLPFDLIPGIIPIVGQLDDLAALLLGIRCALDGCPPEIAQAHLVRVGLSETAIGADLRTVQNAATWLAQGAARVGLRGMLAPFRLLFGPAGRADNQPNKLVRSRPPGGIDPPLMRG